MLWLWTLSVLIIWMQTGIAGSLHTALGRLGTPAAAAEMTAVVFVQPSGLLRKFGSQTKQFDEFFSLTKHPVTTQSSG
jgi:hypothetical protein